MATRLDPLMASASDEWHTPPAILDRAIRAMGGIDLDPACSPEAPAARVAGAFYTRADNGLMWPWYGRIWLNPPYGREVGRWVAKLRAEYEAGRVISALALLAARTDTRWAAELRAFPRCYLRGRLRFGGAPSSAPFPSVIYGLGLDAAALIAAFGDLGDVFALAGGGEVAR